MSNFPTWTDSLQTSSSGIATDQTWTDSPQESSSKSEIDSAIDNRIEEYIKNANLSALSSQLKEKFIEQEFSGLTDKLKNAFDVESKIKELKEDIKLTDQKQIRMIEVLALFVALFSFISINIQVFGSKTLSLRQAWWLILILLWGLWFFLFILHMILNRFSTDSNSSKNAMWQQIIATVLILLCFLIWLFALLQ